MLPNVLLSTYDIAFCVPAFSIRLRPNRTLVINRCDFNYRFSGHAGRQRIVIKARDNRNNANNANCIRCAMLQCLFLAVMCNYIRRCYVLQYSVIYKQKTQEIFIYRLCIYNRMNT